nr:uncharacterized protein LOC109149171 [Ipomoea batatas]
MKEMAQQAGSPVRSSYSNNSSLADIAARVVEEFRAENENDDDEFLYVGDLDAELSLISTADQIFYNGQIRPVFPIFNPNYWESATGTSSMCNSSLSSSGDEQQQQKVSTPPQTMIRLPLRKLLLSEDQETPSSCSSSEADELEGIPEGMYCVWRPKESLKKVQKIEVEEEALHRSDEQKKRSEAPAISIFFSGNCEEIDKYFDGR